MKLKTTIVTVSLAALTALGLTVVPGIASADGPPTPSVTIDLDHDANAFRVAQAIAAIRTSDRDELVQDIVKKTFELTGKHYNVIVQNLSENFVEQLNDTRLYANIHYAHIFYGLWVAESGTFTNQGRGGWENWGFDGWYNRQGNSVTFHKP